MTDNIRRYNRDLTDSAELQNRLSNHIDWYAIPDRPGAWLFGPSKFIGYRDMNAERYLESRENAELHGWDTEGNAKPLNDAFVLVDKATDADVITELNRFLATYGKHLNARAKLKKMKDQPLGPANIPQNPPGSMVATELRKAAYAKGFRIERGQANGWQCYASTTAHGQVFLAGAGVHGPWFAAFDHPGLVAELATPKADIAGPGLARYRFEALSELYDAIDQAYRLGDSLPDAPLQQFEAVVKDLPATTEVERLALQRVGQDIFRKALLRYWRDRCPLTGITELALLRASHIVPWALCDSDAQRLDVHNGLLLSALWDAAFDAGLVSFSDDGSALFSPSVGDDARLALRVETSSPLLDLKPGHLTNLAWHRARHGFL
ncbi:HNH endonuclease signature motif containing protein [Mesorhizobium sp. B1-1-7]|uniref:HNH endonuclease n=1 Tax=Mesorhizobium sp. B1-1-7 TaxID=2589977 RepID=UPI001FEEB4B3|nr:HNH endonuclease signature motif containing protein [Mesorhizobium sp. B1-1-7]